MQHIYQDMLCIVTFVHCTHVHHIAHYKRIRTLHILLLLITVPKGSARASFKYLVTLHRQPNSRCFGRGTTNQIADVLVYKHGNS